MKAIIPACIILTVACLCGCTSTRVADMRHEKDALLTELGAQKAQIKDIETRKEMLEKELASQKELAQTLRQEKNARAKDIATVRREARSFVMAQMQVLRDFSENQALLDYVGGELISRAYVEGQALLLVDMQNPMPSAGILLIGKLFVNDKTDVAFCILRPQGKDLVLIWSSELAAIPGPGLSVVTFNAPVTVEKGDLLGLYSPAEVKVPFSRGTGGTRTLKGPIKAGHKFPIASLEKDDGRMYSFGVGGLLTP